MAISNLLDSDVLLLQRPSVVPMQGRGSGELYKVSMHSIAEYVEETFDTDVVELKEDFAFLNQRLDFIENKILTDVNSTLNDHHYQIVRLEIEVGALAKATDDLEQDLAAALSRAKINFYYELVDDVSPSSGQMTALNENNEVAASLDEVTKLVYNIRDSNDVVERFANVYNGEIVEVTAMNSLKTALTHRAIYSIDNITFGFDLFTFEVTVRNASGTGMPWYQSAFNNLVRSDLYPVFTLSEDEIDEKISKYLPLTGGTITGNFSLKQDLQLAKNAAGIIKYNNTFKIVDNDGAEPFEVSSGAVQIRRNLLMNNKTITGLASTSAPDSAATVSYVNSKISSQVVSEADLFKVGDPVAATSEPATSSKGFYYNGGSLYFKV